MKWICARCNGDYTLAGIDNGRLYSSNNRGVSWAEETPAGSVNIYWRSCAVNASGQMIVGSGSGSTLPPTGRLYSKLAGSWVEQCPFGNYPSIYFGVAISPNGTRMMAACNRSGYTSRLFSYYNGTWVEEQPVGNIDKEWMCCAVNDNGDMIAGNKLRLYIKPAGGTWVETQPDGNNNREWRGCSISLDGTKFIAVAYSNFAWRYESGIWTKINQQPQYPSGSATSFTSCDCDASAEKINLSLSWNMFSNVTMNDIHTQYQWPNVSGNASSGISSDTTLMIIGMYNGRMYIYDRDTLPNQTAEGFYKEFTYTHTAGTRTNFKVRLRVYNKASNNTVLHCEGRANDDFSDIYFTNASGTILRHCLVNDDAYCNGLTNGYCRYVWIELDEVGTSPTTFRMYYGDSTHTDTSTDPTVFFDQYDDFERGVHGDPIGGNWTVTAGDVKIDTAMKWRGTRGVKIVGAYTAGKATIPIPAANETYIGFWVWRDRYSNFEAIHGDGNTYVRCKWDSSGGTAYVANLKNYTNGAYTDVVTGLSTTIWRPIEIVNLKWDSDTYTLYSDYTKRGENLSIQASGGYTNILQIANVVSNGYHTYIDQLVICTNCNPYTSADTDSISAEMINSTSGPATIKTWNVVSSTNIKTI